MVQLSKNQQITIIISKKSKPKVPFEGDLGVKKSNMVRLDLRNVKEL